MVDLRARMPRPRIGLLPTGHFYYWDQFPGLKDMGLSMYARLRKHLEGIGEVIGPELVAMGRNFRVRSGPFSSERFWNEVRAD